MDLDNKRLIEINTQLVEAKEKIRKRDKLVSRHTQASKDLSVNQGKLQDLERVLHKEKADVDKLENLSLSGLFYSVLGSKSEQLEKERQELLAAKLKYDQCRHELEALSREINQLAQDLTRYQYLDQEYTDILQKKEAYLVEVNDQNVEKLIEFSNSTAELNADIRELREAIAVGDKLIEKLDQVAQLLKKAENWGMWDLLGGGLLVTAIKHGNIDQARHEIHAAQELIGRFQRELADVDVTFTPVQIEGFATFADYFFDGLLVDWIIQSRIQDSLLRVKQMLIRVKDVVKRLKEDLVKTKKQAAALRESRKKLIEAAK